MQRLRSFMKSWPHSVYSDSQQVHVCVCVCVGREPGAAPDVTQLGEERSTELSALVNNFILRR
jgi:hypothetical protein